MNYAALEYYAQIEINNFVNTNFSSSCLFSVVDDSKSYKDQFIEKYACELPDDFSYRRAVVDLQNATDRLVLYYSAKLGYMSLYHVISKRNTITQLDKEISLLIAIRSNRNDLVTNNIINEKSSFNLEALKVAISSDNIEIAFLIIGFCNAKNVFLLAVKQDAVGIVCNMISYQSQYDLDMGLAIASFHGRTSIVRLLLASGSDITFRGHAAFCCAVKNGHYEIIAMLLKHGVPSNVRDNYGINTALEANHIDIVELLMDYGALTLKDL